MRDQLKANGQVKCLQILRVASSAILLAAIAANSAYSATKEFFAGDMRFGGRSQFTVNDQMENDAYSLTGSARVDGYILYKSCHLASASTTLEIEGPTSIGVSGILKLGKYTVSTWNKSWDGSAEFTIPTPIGTVVGGEVSFGIGPVGFDLSAKARVGLLVKGSIQVALPPSVASPLVTASIGPMIDASVSAEADLDVGIGSIGIDVDLTLIQAGLTGEVAYSPKSGRDGSVAYDVTADFQGPDGKIRASGTVDLPFLRPFTFSKTLYRYDGDAWSWDIASGHFNF